LSWGYEVVETALAHHIINGYADGTFRSSNAVTRGQLCKMLVLAKGWPLRDPATPSFTDVPRDAAFFRYVETARTMKLISGYADGTFVPNGNITRGQLSKMLYKTTVAP